MNAMSQMLQDLKSRLPPPESVAPINKKTKRTKPLTSSNTKKTKSSNNDMVLSNKFSALDNGIDIDTPATTVNDQANEIEITKAINDMQVDDEFPSLNDSTKINDSKKRAYIPPIVVDKVNDGKKLMGELNALTNEKVTARVVGDKINLQHPTSVNNIRPSTSVTETPKLITSPLENNQSTSNTKLSNNQGILPVSQQFHALRNWENGKSPPRNENFALDDDSPPHESLEKNRQRRSINAATHIWVAKELFCGGEQLSLL
ncbi:hypothetical protein CDAR_492211 [Caerostris darwini]|uniref:Uncharacterized protein n=1 Tax=Caerostris darwini TaxID=1538125 RepID=A0AAV4UZG2_9ARAC|nr:hypothetical protein CDAR_492211 [Caerostris darwini]